MSQPSAAPGWYPDPSGSGQQRYFDGTQWGPYAPPAGAPAPATAERRFTIHYGFGLLAVFALLGTAIPCIFLFSVAANVAEKNADSGGFGVAMAVGWLLWGGMWTIIWSAFAIQHTLRGRKA